MTYIRRHIETLLIDHIRLSTPPYNVILLSGARQCGKTTLLKHLFPSEDHIFINLAKEAGFVEDIDRTESFEDFTFLIESRYQYKISNGKVIIFDEAQLSKRIGNYVRFMKEIWQKQQVILTGSTLSHLFENTQKPTGRVTEFTLRPFNFLEFIDAIENQALLERIANWNIKKPFSNTVHFEAIKMLEQYLLIGGLPEVVLAYKNKGDYIRILTNIFAFYKRDFEAKLSINNLTSIFNQVFLRIAAATGSEIKFSSIIKSSSPGYKHIKGVLSILEAWHEIIKVDCELSRLSQVGSVTPKRYLFDHGIRYLQNPARFNDMDLLDSTSELRNEVGGLLENVVLTELLSTNSPLPPRSWSKTHQSGSVDFVFVDKEKKTYAIEVKSSSKFNRKHLSSLTTYHQFFPTSHLVLASLNPGMEYDLDTKTSVTYVPVYAIYTYLQNSKI